MSVVAQWLVSSVAQPKNERVTSAAGLRLGRSFDELPYREGAEAKHIGLAPGHAISVGGRDEHVLATLFIRNLFHHSSTCFAFQRDRVNHDLWIIFCQDIFRVWPNHIASQRVRASRTESLKEAFDSGIDACRSFILEFTVREKENGVWLESSRGLKCRCRTCSTIGAN